MYLTMHCLKTAIMATYFAMGSMDKINDTSYHKTMYASIGRCLVFNCGLRLKEMCEAYHRTALNIRISIKLREIQTIASF